jgi:PQQ-dependent dehydrogenase (methanol/ethanol family)
VAARRLPLTTPRLLSGVSLVALLAVLGGSAFAAPAPSTSNWASFGRTPDQTRYSPLRQITPGNVDQLGRVFSVRFRELDPTIRNGQQSYPLAIGGWLYVTTNDNNVFGLDATTGRVRWRYTPPNRAVFNNFGIVANRGVGYCAGRLFLATLDMHLVALHPRTGRVLRRVAIADSVPGASPNFGYSETSAPVCANNRVLIGAAGSEYGVRGFVMAWKPDLTPAWANPFWTIPPRQHGWRKASRIAGGGVVWTPVTADARSNTVYFGTGSATPLYYPQLRRGANARTNSLIAVDLRTGGLKWWRRQMTHNEWAYDTAQPPLVYTGRVGGRTRRVVSVATMEGVWFAYDARTGRPIHQRVKVIDRTEHPRLRPGRAVAVFPSSLGGLNYSPASYHPGTNYVLNAAAETAAVLVQQQLTPTQKRRQLVLGDVFLGLENSDFGTVLPGWKDHGSISAINVNTGRRVWKFKTPEPERGGVTTTASSLGFAGGGDGLFRAFDVRNGRILWRFQLSHPIASGATVYSVRGRQFVAITAGGTPTSSNGGTGSELHVFALGGSRNDDPPRRPLRALSPVTVATTGSVAKTAAPNAAARAPAGVRIVTGSAQSVRGWTANSSNTRFVTGRVLVRGRPADGVRVRVGPYVLSRLTDGAGRFQYPVDVTLARRSEVRVVSPRSLRGARGAIDVAFRMTGLRARVQRNGTVAVTGRLTFANGRTSAPPVVLFTYQLRGRIVNADGEPVRGAVVVTRTLDRDFWTFSSPTDANGRYSSLFVASDRSGVNPVPMSVQVAVGTTSYATPFGRNPTFARLRNAVMDIRLPRSGTTLSVPETSSYAGAVYEGILVGVTSRGRVVRPLAARWPDRSGRFVLVLPRSVRGSTIRFWQSHRQYFSRFATQPGGAIDLAGWPGALTARTPQNLAALRVPN